MNKLKGDRVTVLEDVDGSLTKGKTGRIVAIKHTDLYTIKFDERPEDSYGNPQGHDGVNIFSEGNCWFVRKEQLRKETLEDAINRITQ
jgi:hypothetical protein